MRIHLSAIAALVLATPVAYAADYNAPYGHLPRAMAVEDPADDLPPSPALSPLSAARVAWTGFYFGGNAGYGGGEDRYSVRPTAAASQPYGTLSLHADGFAGGAQAGYNYVLGGLGGGPLIGVEADIDGSTINGKSDLRIGDIALSGGSHLDYFGTVRGRVGYVFGSLMVYGTGGFAYGGETSSIQIGTIYSGSTERTHIGYSYGGGFEYALADNISLKTEFVRATLETQRLIGARVDGVVALTHQPTVNLARAGINFHFASWAAPAPVVARY